MISPRQLGQSVARSIIYKKKIKNRYNKLEKLQYRTLYSVQQ